MLIRLYANGNSAHDDISQNLLLKIALIHGTTQKLLFHRQIKNVFVLYENNRKAYSVRALRTELDSFLRFLTFKTNYNARLNDAHFMPSQTTGLSSYPVERNTIHIESAR